MTADPFALARRFEVEAERQLAATDDEFVSGADVAKGIGMDPSDVDLPPAFHEVQERGELRVEGWKDRHGLSPFIGK